MTGACSSDLQRRWPTPARITPKPCYYAGMSPRLGLTSHKLQPSLLRCICRHIQHPHSIFPRCRRLVVDAAAICRRRCCCGRRCLRSRARLKRLPATFTVDRRQSIRYTRQRCASPPTEHWKTFQRARTGCLIYLNVRLSVCRRFDDSAAPSGPPYSPDSISGHLLELHVSLVRCLIECRGRSRSRSLVVC